MDQHTLYESLAKSGFQVLEFLDHPGSFGSWYVCVKRGHKEFRLVFDGRDSLLSLQQQVPSAGWLDIRTQIVSGKQTGFIDLGISWLQECTSA